MERLLLCSTDASRAALLTCGRRKWERMNVRFVPKSRPARAQLKCLTTGNPCVMSLTLRSGGCD